MLTATPHPIRGCLLPKPIGLPVRKNIDADIDATSMMTP